MQLIFFDETKNDKDYPFYHIGGVCIDEADLSDIEGRISELADKSFGNSVLDRGTEFHAAEIFHRKAHFKTWTDFDARLGLLKKFVEILSLKQVARISIRINIDKLYVRNRPLAPGYAFMFLCERSNQLIKARGKMGMLIGDRDTDSIAAKCATSLSSYRVSGTEFRYGQPITHLVDSVHFTHSHLSRFLQLADVYTWLTQFDHRNSGSKNKWNKALLDILSDKNTNLSPSKYKEWPK